MIYETEEQRNVEAEYFDQYQRDNEQADKRMVIPGKEMKPPTLRELLHTQAKDGAWTKAALGIGHWKSMFTFDMEGALVQGSLVDGA